MKKKSGWRYCCDCHLATNQLGSAGPICSDVLEHRTPICQIFTPTQWAKINEDQEQKKRVEVAKGVLDVLYCEQYITDEEYNTINVALCGMEARHE